MWNSLYCSQLHYYLRSKGIFIICLLFTIQPVYRKENKTKKSLSKFSGGMSLLSVHSTGQIMVGTWFKLKVNTSVIYQLWETWGCKKREALIFSALENVFKNLPYYLMKN